VRCVRRYLGPAGFAGVLSCLASGPAWGQAVAEGNAAGAVGAGSLAAVAVRVEDGPSVDGVLDDAVWESAQSFDDFTQSDPLTGALPSERTEFRVVYDEANLYIGVRCHVEDGVVLARQTRRDQGDQGDDAIFITIDSNRDGQSGFFFDVSAAGARTDGLVDNDSGLGTSWDGIWAAKTSVDEAGWSAEIRIPFATLSFDKELTAWGFNISRSMGVRRENVRWRNFRREGNVRQVSRAGLLEGLEDLRQGRGFIFKPFTSVINDLKGGGIDVEPGADLFYRVTPQLTLAVTVNTDFAEAEVDDRVVNLTRFPLFFPERRDFFLEDAGIFDFGGIRRSPRPFFSRRIGVVNGQQKGITTGARLTGRAGDWRIGAMTVQMDNDDELGDKNLSVIRLQRDVLEASNLGVIFTNGDPANRGQNTLFGADFNYRNNSAFGGTGRITGDLFAQGTYTDTVGVENDNSDTTSIGGRLGINRDPWNFNVFLARIGDDYDPALGFVSRRGRHEHNIGGGYTWRFSEEASRVRNVSLNTNASWFTYLDSTIDTFDMNIANVNVNFHSGELVGGRVFVTRDNLIDPFGITNDITIPVGTYDNAGAEIRGGTASNRPIAVNGSVQRYGFFSGDRTDYTVGLNLRPGAYFSANASYSINEIDLDEGDFIVRVFSMRGSVQFTPDLSWDNTVQWDNRSDEFGLNSRVRWEFRPGQEFFVVYNEGFAIEDDFGGFDSVRQRLTIKLGLAFQF
jgi:hypothetical protein